jgi:septal ring factor EnvC (AmiA/AmiB activator)
MSDFKTTLSGWPFLVKAGAAVLILLIVSQVGLSGWLAVQGYIQHRKDAIVDKAIQESDKRIESLEQEKAQLDTALEQGKKERAALTVELAAKNQLIDQADKRIQAGDKQIEGIIEKFKSEDVRISELDSDAVYAELVARFKAAGKLRE